MTLQRNETKSMIWILLPVFLAFLVSAIVGLPLFQDGSSYLLELLISGSAVRHGRLSILLFQSPTIFLIKTLQHLGADSLSTLPLVRLVFNLNYALPPLVSLSLSWLVVRRKRSSLFIWAALIILLVNLVNYSWVSELLIAVQFSCPLLLALLQDPRSKLFWSLFIFLAPFLFFLHPLVIALYLIMAAASAYISYRQPAYRGSATLSLILFLLAAVLRGIYSFFTLSSYEVNLMSAGETTNYLVISRLENLLFLGITVEIAFFILLSHPIVRSKWLYMKGILWFISLQWSFLLLLTARFLLQGKLSPIVLIIAIGIPVVAHLWTRRDSSAMEKTRWLYISCVILALAASSLLIAQYVSAERLFTLKMGLDFLVVLLIMIVAMIDSVRNLIPSEEAWRFRLAVSFSVIFAGALLAKSAMWQVSVIRLEETLRQSHDSCIERNSADFRWLETSPYTILNNWALPSLALVVQDKQPRKALLEQDDCQVLQQSGMIQVDPWSRFSKEFMVPPLE